MSRKPMPPLVRLYIVHSLIGFGIAAIFVGLMVAIDLGGLRGLLLRSDDAWLALAMLWFANGTVFAAVQFGWAVMAMAEDRPPRGGRPVRQPAAIAVPVRGETRP